MNAKQKSIKMVIVSVNFEINLNDIRGYQTHI